MNIAKIYLILASLIFYGYWNVKYVPIIIGSVIFNFAIGTTLSNWVEREERHLRSKISKKAILAVGIMANVLLLGYYKYCDFFIANFNFIFNAHLEFLHIALPLAISFFTFQQISYLVDSYKGQTKEYDFLNYTLFVTFFPQLIAGPIVRHNEMMPQFQKVRTKVFNWKNFCEGLFQFITGLFKKVFIADIVAVWANNGYANCEGISAIASWVVILSYTFQIYYDFSGYTDMALGIGKMLNIYLPQNFNNPYSATSIEDFWRKWHMTLSRFLKDYVYIPLGGNKTFMNIQTKFASYINVMITFFISGLWHGASWMFVIWGISHGIVNCINKFLRTHSINIPNKLSWLMTFIYINLTWVFFRSENITEAKNILKGVFCLNNFYLPKFRHLDVLYGPQTALYKESVFSLFVPLILIFFIFFPVFNNLKNNFKPNTKYLVIAVILFVISVVRILNPNFESPFIYFNF